MRLTLITFKFLLAIPLFSTAQNLRLSMSSGINCKNELLKE